MVKTRIFPFSLSLIVGTLVIAGTIRIQNTMLQERDKLERDYAEKRLAQIASSLSQSMNIRLSLTNSLGAYVLTGHLITQKNFDTYAGQLLEDYVGIRSLQLAPGGIVTFLTDVESNRAAVGHDLFADEERRHLVEKAVRERSQLISGPIDLVQGGKAIIARRPLFWENPSNHLEEFWGFATVLIEVEPLLKDAGYFDLEKDFLLSIRGKDGLGDEGDVFFGETSTFKNALATATVTFPDASWLLAAKQTSTSEISRGLNSSLYLGIPLIFALLLAVATYLVTDRPRKLRLLVGFATENLKITLDSIGDAVISTDLDGVVMRLNPIAESLTGWSLEDARGRPLREIFNTIDAKTNEPAFNSIQEVLKKGKAVGLANDTILIAKDGTHSSIVDSASPIRSTGGEIDGAVIVFRDVTDENQTRSHLEQQQKIEALGTLSSGIAHDFNNCLQAILGYCSLARDNSSGNAMVDKCLNEIESGGQRAADLVDQILTFSRQGETKFEPLDLRVIVDDALKFIRSTVPTTIKIESNFETDCAQVMANSTQIHQVVTNLCTNAMHALENQTGRLSISLTPISIDSETETLSGRLQRGDYVQLSVMDTGVGIDSTTLNRVIEPFFTTKEVGKGTGLGLAVVHGIVKNMYGGLTIESELGKGTIVSVIVPVIQKSDVAYEKSPSAISPSSQRHSHIMLVDDEESITILTMLTLEGKGFTVEAFNNVGSALEAAKGEPKKYDLAILDYTMPDKTGVELARNLESLMPKMPVIIVSGILNKSELEEFKSSNIVDIVRKPYDMNVLIELVNQVLNRDCNARLKVDS